MNKKKVISYDKNKIKASKQVNFNDKIELDKEKFIYLKSNTKRSKKNNNKEENNFNKDLISLSSNEDYYKSFLKSLNETNKEDENKQNEEKKKKIKPPNLKLNFSPLLENDKRFKKKNIKREKTQLTFQDMKNNSPKIIKRFSPLKIRKSNYNSNHININIDTISFNQSEQNQGDKTRRTDFKKYYSNKNKNKNFLDYSLPNYLNISQSLLSEDSKNNLLPVKNSFSNIKKREVGENSTISLNNNKKIGLSKTYKNQTENNLKDKDKDKDKEKKKKENQNENKVNYIKGNFLNVKKIDINNNKRKKSINTINTNKNENTNLDNKIEKDNLNKDNKDNKEIIIPKKKKFLFCCIPLH